MFENNYLSIDLGREYTKLVYGSYKNNMIKIMKIGKFKTPFNSYKEGRLTNIGLVRGAINRVLDEWHLRGRIKTIITMDSSEIITREVELPYAKDIDLNAMVSFELQEYLPINIEDYVVQAKILEQFEEEGLKKLRTVAAMMPKSMVEELYNFLNSVGLEPYVLDIHSNAISKYLSHILLSGDNMLNKYNTFAVVDLGAEHTNVCVIENKMIRLNKLIELGGSAINDMIASTFGLDQEQAEEKKTQAIHLFQEEGEVDATALLNDMTKSTVNGIIDQVQLVLKYYSSREQNKQIDAILLFGGGANLKGLSQYIENAFNLPTYVLGKHTNLQFLDKNYEAEDLKYYLNCFGALIRR